MESRNGKVESILYVNLPFWISKQSTFLLSGDMDLIIEGPFYGTEKDSWRENGF